MSSFKMMPDLFFNPRENVEAVKSTYDSDSDADMLSVSKQPEYQDRVIQEPFQQRERYLLHQAVVVS
jgi:hypothetical protein